VDKRGETVVTPTPPAALWRHAAFTLRLRRTFRISRGASDTRDTLLVALHRDGIVGLGEGAPPPRYGESIGQARALADAYLATISLPTLPGASAETLVTPELLECRSLQMAADIALHDWLAKARRMPLHEMLGMMTSRTPPTSYTLSIESPEMLVSRLREADAFAALKIKLGGPQDEEALIAVRRATDKAIRVDANEGWTPEVATRLAHLCAEMRVELIEQPLPAGHLEATAQLRANSPVPIFADEDFRTVDDIARLAGVYDGINVKLVKCGGIREAIRAIREARAHGMRAMIGCGIESSVGIAAAVAISPLADFVDLDGAILTSNDPAAGLRLVDGRLVAGAGVGLGVGIRDEDLGRALVGPW
jgi:L-alanine-DL-glutamate epimerase-like enolase superfamily enzyme